MTIRNDSITIMHSTPLTGTGNIPNFLRRQAFGNLSNINCVTKPNGGSVTQMSSPDLPRDTQPPRKPSAKKPEAAVTSRRLECEYVCTLRRQQPIQSLSRYSKLRQPLRRRSDKSRERLEALRRKYADVRMKRDVLLDNLRQLKAPTNGFDGNDEEIEPANIERCSRGSSPLSSESVLTSCSSGSRAYSIRDIATSSQMSDTMTECMPSTEKAHQKRLRSTENLRRSDDSTPVGTSVKQKTAKKNSAVQNATNKRSLKSLRSMSAQLPKIASTNIAKFRFGITSLQRKRTQASEYND